MFWLSSSPRVDGSIRELDETTHGGLLGTVKGVWPVAAGGGVGVVIVDELSELSELL